MDGVRAVLLAGGEGRRMGPLGRGRLKPLVPFGGTSRLIDFSIANVHRSGLRDVLLLSQYEERRLMDDLHLIWNGRHRGFRIDFGPYDAVYRRSPGKLPEQLPERTWPLERGTADALLTKAEYVFRQGDAEASEILVLHADHVYRFDYGDMIREHRASKAALTVSYQRIERRYVHLFGMVEFDGDGLLTAFEEKPDDPTSDLVFAAFCLFDAATLRRYLEQLRGTDWQHDISRDVIPAMLAGGELIRGYEVKSYWEDIGTVDRYHRAHRGLLRADPTLALSDMPLTVAPEVPRHLVPGGPGRRASVVAADVANEGEIVNSVVYPGARIGVDAHVVDCVVLPGARVPDGTHLASAIVLEDGSVQQCEAEREEVAL
ncbi:sugar phosphate nucleotidyltransferase [Streptomyces olivaceoviridis]|uniref:sugar phosphate nucleotidyltransferase n=1 Tax=Streptomyces olivaceoviridis TaxID=1921 RepID=UPI0036B0DC57